MSAEPVPDAPIEVVIFDFDGVVRHWTEQDTSEVEVRHGLPDGSIMGAAFGPELGEAVVTGKVTHEQWFARIAQIVGSAEAVAEWSQHRGRVDPDAVALIDELRRAGLTVALLSNATTRLEEDLDVLGLAPHLDVVFNTARLGVCKPNPEVYRLVVERLGVPGPQVVFTDDHPGWAAAAGAADVHGIPFHGVPALRASLRELGVPVLA
jgi:HAD superfamily hydrolase (TIGR01509 family)